MDRRAAAVISPREMIGLAEICDRAGDRSFAILMVECALSVLSRNGATIVPSSLGSGACCSTWGDAE